MWNATLVTYIVEYMATLQRQRNLATGLHMILGVVQEEYLPGLASSAGLVLVIHAQHRMPFPEDEGLYLEPGRATVVGIRQVSCSHFPISDNHSHCDG